MADAPVVALLRGVNIGKRRLAMADLRARLTEVGCEDVRTYVQSGNVVLRLPRKPGRNAAAWLAGEISAIAGFDVQLVLRTGPALRDVVHANPYPDMGGTALHVVFFDPAPTKNPTGYLDLDALAPEHATLVGRELYLKLPGGIGRSALATVLFKRKDPPGTVTTVRNWNTVLKLASMAGAPA